MNKLVLLEGKGSNVDAVAQALKFGVDAVVLDPQSSDSSTARLMGQINVLKQVAEQSSKPVVFVKSYLFKSLKEEARDALHELIADCKVIIVTDENQSVTTLWLQRLAELKNGPTLVYDMSEPATKLFRFVKGE